MKVENIVGYGKIRYAYQLELDIIIDSRRICSLIIHDNERNRFVTHKEKKMDKE